MDDVSISEPEATVTAVPDRAVRTRRGFLGALIASLVSALLIGVLWLLARGAPSARRDPELTPPALR